jgi:hypothetical protein
LRDGRANAARRFADRGQLRLSLFICGKSGASRTTPVGMNVGARSVFGMCCRYPATSNLTK